MIYNPFRYLSTRGFIFTLGMIAMAGFLVGCGRQKLPLLSIQQSLKDKSTYSIILEDMKEEGNFIKSYFHQYRIIEPETSWTTGWEKVPETFYQANEGFLGMTLFSKQDGEIRSTVGPPGYAYVGDSRYGHWRNDDHGNSFWEFYGKYALFSQFFGGWYRPIYRNDYDMYNHYRNRGQTYYGKNNEYGSNGSIAKRQKPNFYARRMSTIKSGRNTFSTKVSSKIGRTKFGFRGRAGGKGK